MNELRCIECGDVLPLETSEIEIKGYCNHDIKGLVALEETSRMQETIFAVAEEPECI